MLLLFITFYQKIISPALKQLLGTQSMCRFSPSCSEYAKIVIKNNGTIKGSYMIFIRLLQCQPYGKIPNSKFQISKNHNVQI